MGANCTREITIGDRECDRIHLFCERDIIIIIHVYLLLRRRRKYVSFDVRRIRVCELYNTVRAIVLSSSAARPSITASHSRRSHKQRVKNDTTPRVRILFGIFFFSSLQNGDTSGH